MAASSSTRSRGAGGDRLITARLGTDPVNQTTPANRRAACRRRTEEHDMTDDTLSHSLHDAGLAAWFGGTLAEGIVTRFAGEQRRPSSGLQGLVDRVTP